MKLPAVFLITLYLGTSPVYWVPFIDVSIFSKLKFILIASSVVFIWMYAASIGRIKLPKGMAGIIGFAVLFISSVFALMQAQDGLFVKRMMDMVLGFTMLWSFYLLSISGGDIKSIFKYAALMISIFCWIIVFSKVFGQPAWRAPAIFNSDLLSTAGFGSLRTGWSNGVALFVPILLLLMAQSKENIKSVIISIIGVVGIIGSQVVVAGRAGLLTSLTSIFIYSLFRVKKIYLVVLVAVIVMLAITFSDFLLVQFRFDRLEEGAVSEDALDSFSAGRIGSYLEALEMAAENPVFGYGFGNAIIHDREIHNFWLRMLVEGGFLYPLVFFMVLMSIILKLKSQIVELVHLRKSGVTSNNLISYLNISFCIFLIILGGVIESFFEPNIFLGSFQNNAIWWAAAGVAVALYDMKNNESFSGASVSQESTKSKISSSKEVEAKYQSVKLKNYD